MLDENNKQRKAEAERIAFEAIHANVSPTSSATQKRKHSNNRYKNKGIPIRETRSSKLRKNALVREVMKHKVALRNQTSNIKTPKKVTKKKENLNKSLASMDESLLDRSFDVRSPIVDRTVDDVHPDRFVTKSSYIKYRRKAMQRLEEDDMRFTNNLMTQRFDAPITEVVGSISRNSATDMLSKSLNRVIEKNLPSSHADNFHLKNILQSYGLPMDSDLFERKSETSLLLVRLCFLFLKMSLIHGFVSFENHNVSSQPRDLRKGSEAEVSSNLLCCIQTRGLIIYNC